MFKSNFVTVSQKFKNLSISAEQDRSIMSSPILRIEDGFILTQMNYWEQVRESGVNLLLLLLQFICVNTVSLGISGSGFFCLDI